MKGFNKGVTTVLKVFAILFRSREFWADGLTYRNMVEPNQMVTTLRWAEQVEKAFFRPWADWIRRMEDMMYM